MKGSIKFAVYLAFAFMTQSLHCFEYNNDKPVEENVVEYCDDDEIVGITIWREGFEQGHDGYKAIAWLIWNRMKDNSFPKKARDVCLQNGQFNTWSAHWGKTKVPKTAYILDHHDWGYCLGLARVVNRRKFPSKTDSTNGALHFARWDPKIEYSHPKGIKCGSNWYW